MVLVQLVVGPVQLKTREAGVERSRLFFCRKVNMTEKAYHYRTCCVNATGRDINDMVDACRDISYRTFRRHCEGVDAWAVGMGYAAHPSRGLTLSADWHVSYHKSRYRGKPCYYLRHSAIEYIWVKQESQA